MALQGSRLSSWTSLPGVQHEGLWTDYRLGCAFCVLVGDGFWTSFSDTFLILSLLSTIFIFNSDTRIFFICTFNFSNHTVVAWRKEGFGCSALGYIYSSQSIITIPNGRFRGILSHTQRTFSVGTFNLVWACRVSKSAIEERIALRSSKFDRSYY